MGSEKSGKVEHACKAANHYMEANCMADAEHSMAIAFPNSDMHDHTRSNTNKFFSNCKNYFE
jgi:hypothetical protein